MKTRKVVIIAAAIVIAIAAVVVAVINLTFQEVNINYPVNREPLLQTKYIKLPLGAIKPEGWLKEQLTIQANGLTGHLYEFWEPIKNSGWKGDGKENLEGNYIVNYVSNYLDGLIPLAYLLNDKDLINKSNKYIEHILASESLHDITSNTNAWSYVGRFLTEYYEVTSDQRVLPFLRKCFELLDETGANGSKWAEIRVGEYLSFSYWLYNQTAYDNILNIIEKRCKDNIDDWKSYFDNFPDVDSLKGGGRHGVDIAQAIKFPGLWYMQSKDESYKGAVYNGLRNLDKYHGQVGGRFNADEYLAGKLPTQGSELCTIVELMYSMEKLFEVFGEVEFADRLEYLTYNSLPGTCTPDMWAHQ